MQDRSNERARMVASQIEARGVRDARVLAAMREVPREVFVAPVWSDDAYADRPLPIGKGQTISQPYIVAAMLEAARIGPEDRVLEVGAGSGYAAALAGRLGRSVIAVERLATLAEAAQRHIAALGIGNVEVRVGDGSLGAAADAPFDVILVAASGPAVPEALRRQLAVGGRLVLPVGERSGPQRLLRITRTGAEAFAEEALEPVSFVPLIGEGGWQEG